MSADEQLPTTFDELVVFVADDGGADHDQWAIRYAGGVLKAEPADETTVLAREREEYGGNVRTRAPFHRHGRGYFQK